MRTTVLPKPGMRERVSAMGFVPRLLLFGLPTLLIVSQCSERPDYPSAAFRSAAGGSGGAPGHEAQMSEQASDPFSETRIEAEFDEAKAAGTTRALKTFIEIGREHVCTPVNNAHLVCRLMLEKKKNN